MLGLLWTLLLVFAAGVLHVVVHEAAHALVARATGIAVPEVSVGGGRAWLRFRVLGTVVKVGGFLGGVTLLEPRAATGLRTKLALVTAAGPLSNVALALVVWLLPDAAAGSLMEEFQRALVRLGIALAVVNLLPLTLRRGAVRTDGAVLLSLGRHGGRYARQALASGRLSAAQRRHAAGEVPEDDDWELAQGEPFDRSDPVVLGAEGTRRIFTGQLEEAVDLLREAARLHQGDHERALTLNNLAWALILARPEGWVAEADAAIAEAIRLEPRQEAFRSTRGCVLVERGDLAEGRKLLQECDLSEAAPGDRVIVDHHLLRAEAGLGNLYGARAALFRLIDDGASAQMVTSSRALLRPMEVQHALTTMIGADGRIDWPQHRPGDELGVHMGEMRSALAAFVDEAAEDPRGEAVRLALGGG